MSEEIIGWKQEDPVSEGALDPYRPPEAVLAVPPAEAGLVLADPGSRLVARIVDAILQAASMIPGFLLLFALENEPWIGGSVLAVGFLAVLGYQIYLLIAHGQTVGKRMLGVRIVRLDGSRVSASRLFFLRFLVLQVIGAVPILGGLVVLGGYFLIFREDRRCLHDHFADTQVVLA